MRVLMLGWEFPPHISGGLGTACAGIVRGLAGRGVRVLFVLPRLAGGEQAAGAEILGADVEMRAVASRLQPYAAIAEPRITGLYGRDLEAEVNRYAVAVARIAARERFDLVHAHDWMTWPAAIRAARAAGVPLVVHVHSLEHDRAGPRANAAIAAIEQRGLDAADAVVCVSRYTADQVKRRYGTAGAKLRVVHNATSPGDSPPPPRGPRHIDDPVVLFLGRVTYQKGPEAFLEAAARVVRAVPRVKFVVAGSGDLLPSLVERAARLGLARHVHFTGFLRGADVEKAWSAADVFVMPSVSEPFGIAPLEAAARDVPAIVSRQSGVTEVLRGALMVDSWDVDDLANKIVALLHRPPLRRELVARGRLDASRLTWEGQAALLRRLYEELLP
jgi:glycosyltransferase involved in cell wall biosynthesis